MSLEKEQIEMYERHSKEEEDFLNKVVKSLFEKEIDFIGSGSENYNDDGGSDEYKNFVPVRRDWKNEEITKTVDKDLKQLRKFMSSEGLDLDFNHLFDHLIHCEYDGRADYKLTMQKTGEVSVEEISFDEKLLYSYLLDNC